MLVLGIDTSCDDTSASVVESGTKIISNSISNQTDIHKKYGGIVPELASRRHIEMIWPLVDEAMKTAGISFRDLACIAVCHGPGLIGSLLVGCSFAKALCYAKKIPLVAVNHLEGHIFSPFLEKTKPDYPFIALIVSGGHTCLYRVDDFGKYFELGRTRDDAAGEAYDKVSKLLGLGYPGGPVIDNLSHDGNPDAISFPRAYLPESLDFSFSGLKTNFLYFLRDRIRSDPDFIEKNKADLCASLQHTIISILTARLVKASIETGITEIGIAGGVSANSGLRDSVMKEAERRNWNLFMPEISLTTDNAAMIGITGYYKYIRGEFAGQDIAPLARL